MVNDILPWVAFNIVIAMLLAADLFLFHREAHKVSIKEAAGWSVFWIVLSLIFNAGIFLVEGSDHGTQFLTGYVIEKSLSVDNIFVFVMLFSYFSVPSEYQHRVLFLGILGALVMRAIFIAAGVSLLENFHWIIFPFGAFLIFTGLRMLLQKEGEVHPENNPVLRLARRYLPVTDDYMGQRFIVRQAGRLMVTPLLLVLIVVETTDVIFAVDSVPAVLAISRDPFIVYTSNACAILGLRALYFLLAGIVRHFRYLKEGLSLVLIFVGVKMATSEAYEIPTFAALGVVASIIGAAALASVIALKREGTKAGETEAIHPPHNTPAEVVVPSKQSKANEIAE